jgi:hypothetical protein
MVLFAQSGGAALSSAVAKARKLLFFDDLVRQATEAVGKGQTRRQQPIQYGVFVHLHLLEKDLQ